MNKQRIRKSLKVSFLDGIFASCVVGLTTDYVTAYALTLKRRLNHAGY